MSLRLKQEKKWNLYPNIVSSLDTKQRCLLILGSMSRWGLFSPPPSLRSPLHSHHHRKSYGSHLKTSI
uniref:Uncharacterized protein n=1 Tax=Octopus bimaculoides TaxID=37653 RepID=A0A0L8GFT3_OCTBM